MPSNGTDNTAVNGTVNRTYHVPNPTGKGLKPNTQRNRPLTQVVQLQDIIFNEVVNNRPEKGNELASLVRAWCDCEERRRVLKGVPLPGSRKPEPRQRRPRSVSADPVPSTLTSTPQVVVDPTPLT